jgi:hypothetical protein
MDGSNRWHVTHFPVDEFHPVVLGQDAGLEPAMKLGDVDAVDWWLELLRLHEGLAWWVSR